MDLVEILKDVPKGTKLWSVLHGEVKLLGVELGDYNYPIVCETLCVRGNKECFTEDGRFYNEFDGECVLFPSRECREWSKFNSPKFDTKMLKPFDQVLVRNSKDGCWFATIFSHIDGECNTYVASFTYWKYCIPYNEETKHLVGTKNDPPSFYRV